MSRVYNVIDADGHILEPLNLWDKYMDPKYRNRAPRLVVDEQGRGHQVADHRGRAEDALGERGALKRNDLVGDRIERDSGVGREAGDEYANLNPQIRRDRRAASHSTSRADSRLPQGLEGSWSHAHAARFREPQYFRFA